MTVIDMASQREARRPKVYTQLVCLWCGTEHAKIVSGSDDPKRYYDDCPGCDEAASVPVWRVL